MAELPRCASCRVSVEPGQNVVFRPDGRVEHVACPEVTCPVCSRSIRPHDPIRRDGNALLHGNCWLRRVRRRAIGAGHDVVPTRVAVISARLLSGALPSAAPTKTWGGYGNGALCDACGDRIAVGKLELEVDFVGAATLRFHPECFEVWQVERERTERRITGGSAVLPWALMFDVGIARLAVRDPGAHAELLTATADTRLAAADTRMRSRVARERSLAQREGGARSS